MPTTLNSGLQLPDKGSVDWYSSMQNNYNLLDNHLENTNIHVTAEDKANWDSKQGSLSQAQLDAIAQVATNTNDIATLQSSKANASHTHSSSDITDIGDYATKQYVDNSISGLVDSAPDALDTLNELSAALNDDANFASTVTTALAAKANSADLATVATSGSYSDLTDKPTIPTNTSDLINDSNFVDTSNSAVASGITSAKVTDYDTHIADTDIHVTTADKTTWNTVTSKANDSDVVHTSGNETVGGIKTFTDSQNLTGYTAIRIYSPIDEVGVLPSTTQVREIKFTDKNNVPISYFSFQHRASSAEPFRTCWRQQKVDGTSSYYSVNFNNLGEFYPEINNPIKLGTSTNRWAEVYAQSYYYGSNNIEFSTKFVTTDTNQTITGAKTFNSNAYIYNSDATATTPNLYLRSSKIEISSQGNTSGDQNLTYLDKNNTAYANVKGAIQSNGSAVKIRAIAKDSSDNSVINELQMLAYTNGNKAIFPSYSDDIDLGTSSYRWKSIYATNYYYGSNNVEFSTKFVTTDTAQTISGTKTFTDNIIAKRIVSNVSQLQINAKSNADSVAIIGGNSASDGGGVWVYGKNTSNKSMVTLQVYDTDNSVYHAVRLNMDGSLTPTVSNNGLGSSSYKWVSFNGLNPGALSLPDTSNSIDISGYITDLTGSVNTYTALADGYVSIRITGTAMRIAVTNGVESSSQRSSAGAVACYVPVVAGETVSVYAVGTGINNAIFRPCKGNV